MVWSMESMTLGSTLMTKITRFVRYVKKYNIKVFNHKTKISNNELLKEFDRIEDIIVERVLTFAGHWIKSACCKNNTS